MILKARQSYLTFSLRALLGMHYMCEWLGKMAAWQQNTIAMYLPGYHYKIVCQHRENYYPIISWLHTISNSNLYFKEKEEAGNWLRKLKEFLEKNIQSE